MIAHIAGGGNLTISRRSSSAARTRFGYAKGATPANRQG